MTHTPRRIAHALLLSSLLLPAACGGSVEPDPEESASHRYAVVVCDRMQACRDVYSQAFYAVTEETCVERVEQLSDAQLADPDCLDRWTESASEKFCKAFEPPAGCWPWASSQ